MENFSRYAVYYAPDPGDFADLASSWLGWDAAHGQIVSHPVVPGLPLLAAEITQTPRTDGFHGTLKPPFRLAPATSVQGLHEALTGLSDRLSPVEMPGLSLHPLGRFLALTPTGDQTALARLAATIVQELDYFRAAPTDTELEKRRKSRLSEKQNAYLETWGYPYVMDEFRFHLTLTGRLPKSQVETVAQSLEAVFAPVLPTPFKIPNICLFGEAEDGRFHILHRYTLSG
jgi:putative phosphonate metabolism protein